MSNFKNSPNNLAEETRDYAGRSNVLKRWFNHRCFSVDRQEAELAVWADPSPLGIFLMSGDRLVYATPPSPELPELRLKTS